MEHACEAALGVLLLDLHRRRLFLPLHCGDELVLVGLVRVRGKGEGQEEEEDLLVITYGAVHAQMGLDQRGQAQVCVRYNFNK